MKTLFIPLIKPLNKVPELNNIPKEIFIAYSIQYKELASRIKEKLGKRVKGFQQVLGCTKLETKYPILLIGSGKFHALNLALQGNQVYIYEQGKITRIDDKELEKLKIRKKIALSKFYSAERIGILVSLKPGQEHLDKAIKLQASLKKQGKQAFIFIANNLNLFELENFQLDSWVNTACPGLELDAAIINIQDTNF